MFRDHLNRREVLKTAAVGVAATMAIDPSSSSSCIAGQTSAGYIDAHSHIWTRDVSKYPLASGKKVEDLDPPSFTAEELLKVARSENVDRVVLICHHPYYGFDNSYLIDAAARYPQSFRIVGALDEKQPHPDSAMRDLLQKRVTGFRISPHVSGEQWLDSPGMNTMWEAAANTRQAMCCLMNPEHIGQVQKMCEKYRQTSVVIDHFARIGMNGKIQSEDVERLCELSRFERVYIKISAYYALGKKKPPYHDLVPMIKRLHGQFGAERLMWASDSPYQLQGEHSYRASLSLVRDHLNFLNEKDREWLLHRTAEQVFFFV